MRNTLPSATGSTLRIAKIVPLLLLGVSAANAKPPSPEEALSLTPIQSHVDYAQPADADVSRCTVRPEKTDGGSAWVVRGPDGQLLRRFADSNNDNVVDQWSYFQDGLEVYRDVDADYNGKADQYRWYHTGGTRFGIDKNEDGRIDRWQAISAQEVAEELVIALKSRDAARFGLLLASPEDVTRLGLGETQQERLTEQVKSAPNKFRNLVREQDVIAPDSKYLDFGASRPATVPAGTNGSTKDVTVYENVSALVESGKKHEQVYLGTLISVDGGWKLLNAPSFEAGAAAGFISPVSTSLASGGAGDVPTEQMQKLMEQLQRLDSQAGRLPAEQQGKLTRDRAQLLSQLAEITTDPKLRQQWVEQLADMLSAAVQVGGYQQGVEQLAQLEKKIRDSDGAGDLLAHVKFQRMFAVYMLSQQQKDPDYAKIQEKWLEDLESFVEEFPNSPDTAEALLQLAMSREFSGQSEEAQKWYGKIVKGFSGTDRAGKAAGALRRFTCVGKPITLRGSNLGGGSTDLADYKGKVVLIQYWATWCEPCKNAMPLLKDLYAKNRNRGFEIVGVCLEDEPGPARQLLAQTKLPWPQIYESGGINNSRLAKEMGVVTLPLMLLVDQEGKVVSRNIHAEEVDAEIKRLLR